MTRIRASCPSCGEVDLTPDQVLLAVYRDDEGQVAAGSHYRFECPDCVTVVTKPADTRIAELLTTGGVPTEEEPVPAEDPRPRHPEDPPGGPALTLDDLLDLHELLREPDWFARLEAVTSRP